MNKHRVSSVSTVAITSFLLVMISMFLFYSADHLVRAEQPDSDATRILSTVMNESMAEPSLETTAEAAPGVIEEIIEATPEAISAAAQAEVTSEPSPEATAGAAVEAAEATIEAAVEATDEVAQPPRNMPQAANEEPDIELSVACPYPNTARFTLRNSGGDMSTPGTYTVSSPAKQEGFQFAAGESITFEAAGDATVEVRYSTLSLESVFLSATGQCTPRETPTSQPEFTPTPRITFTPSYTPTVALVPSVTPAPTISSTPAITSIPTATMTPDITSTPANTLLPPNTPTIAFTPGGTLTPSITQTTSPTVAPTVVPGGPEIELSVACLLTSTEDGVIQARFRLRNVGSSMLGPGTVTVTVPGQKPEAREFRLDAGEKLDFIAAGNAEVQVVYTSATLSGVYLSVTGTCTAESEATQTPTSVPLPLPTRSSPPDTTVPTDAPDQTDLPPDQNAPTSVPSMPIRTDQPALEPAPSTVCGDVNSTGQNGFPEIVMSECNPDTSMVEREPWAFIAVGAAVCTDWLAYHSNMTGDWEIFRFGDLPDGLEADPNLSRGIGSRVHDLMPSRSPDQIWIAFTSNRDGNWEVYVSAVAEDFIQRVTYNTTAIDVDPVWSPTDGRIIYESNRDGNWNLFLFNVDDGTETRLTNSTGNDINASWSSDGTRIVFQSDRDGFWQIYELELSTLQQLRLSDGVGDDHAPQYARDSQHIAFRSFRDGENSIVYVMKADGSDVTAVSDAAGYAINHAWAPDSTLIAYQSNLDGDNDIYVYDTETQTSRLVTDNSLEDYAPTWICDAPTLVFTSDVTGDSNLFSTAALPIGAAAIRVEEEASQLTFDRASDQYPLDSPSEENASRQESFPSPAKSKRM